jgi:hypothetical protein
MSNTTIKKDDEHLISSLVVCGVIAILLGLVVVDALASMKINIGDNWKTVVAVKENINDSWKYVETGYGRFKVNINDTWKNVSY